VGMKNRRLPSGEKGSLKYHTALNDDVFSRLNLIITQSDNFSKLFYDHHFQLVFRHIANSNYQTHDKILLY
jgi:hypothetical protein